MLDENDWLEEVDDLDVDFNHLRRKYVKGGYREGVTAGQEFILQTSFNAGFRESSLYHEKVAQYRGCLSAIMLFLSMDERCPQGTVEKIEDAILRLEKLEDNEKHVNTMLEDRKMSIHLDSKLCNLDSIQPNEQVPIEDGVLDELSVAMKDSFQSVCEDDDVMEESDVEIGKCGSCDCEGNNHSNRRKKNLCRDNESQHDTSGVDVSGICEDVSSSQSRTTSTKKSTKVLSETIVAMQEIVLDQLHYIHSFIDPLMLKKIKDVLTE